MSKTCRLFLVLFLALHTWCGACDTNLLSLISGSGAGDSFVEKSSELVALSVKLGRNIDSAATAKPVIQEIMNAWISFDNNFSQSPPEWAKKDENWKNKLKKLADLIGQINSSMNAGDLTTAHNTALEFSKRLTVLYECMPKSVLGEQLYKISINLLKLNELFVAQDVVSFASVVDATIEAVASAGNGLDDNHRKIVEPMQNYLQELKSQLQKDEKAFNFKVKMTLMTVEDAYVKMNEQLNQPTAGEKKLKKEH
ncbi:MAG: hypothetical protein ACOYXC_12645 [Candidatus Rifleibacteriota bacterium]